jgi:hypothetical protein
MSVLVRTVCSMKMPDEWLGEATQMFMTDRHAGHRSVVLWGAVLSLTGGVRLTSLMVQMETAPNHTEWRALWMTESLVGFASITRTTNAGRRNSDDDQADSVTSWARPIRDVKSVGLGHVECKKVHGYGEERRTGGGRRGRKYSSATVPMSICHYSAPLSTTSTMCRSSRSWTQSPTASAPAAWCRHLSEPERRFGA